MDHKDADVIVVPCLEESWSRCTDNNTRERPPDDIEGEVRRLSSQAEVRDRRLAWDAGSPSRCLQRVYRSEAFKQRGGRDHIFVAAYWDWQFHRPLQVPHLKNFTLGQIEIVDKIEADISYRTANIQAMFCSVVVPFASDVGYHIDYNLVPTFEEWQARPHVVTYWFNQRKYFLGRENCNKCINATYLRRQALRFAKAMPESSIKMARLPVLPYTELLQQSRFCLVIRGDTPSTHAFYDAVAASCVPVLISDRFEDVALPLAHGQGRLHGGIDISLFTIRVPQGRWIHDPYGVAKQIRDHVSQPHHSRFLFQNLQYYRPLLLWSMPGTRLHEEVLLATWACNK